MLICGVPLILPRVKHGAGLLRRTSKYASLLRISGALHLGIFDQPVKNEFSNRLIILSTVFNQQSSAHPEFYNLAQRTYLPIERTPQVRTS